MCFSLWSFLDYLKYLQTENSVISSAYHDHIQVFCTCILDELKGRYCDDWESNFALGFWHIRRQHRTLYLAFKSNLSESIRLLTSNGSCRAQFYDQIGYTFRNILTKADKSRMYSRAAAYCIQFLSNHDSELRPEAHGFIQIRSINRRIRQHRPWHWHRTFRHRLQTDQLLHTYNPPRYSVIISFAEMLKVEKDPGCDSIWACSIFSGNWNSRDKTPSSKLPYKYMTYLEYLVEILPQAEPYIPLINMCRTKTFSRMSIAFPALSRRARRMMAEYLERAESTIGTGDLNVEGQ